MITTPAAQPTGNLFSHGPLAGFVGFHANGDNGNDNDNGTVAPPAYHQLAARQLQHQTTLNIISTTTAQQLTMTPAPLFDNNARDSSADFAANLPQAIR
eukprot:5538127-Karenia_brevis.AAC.1